MKNLNITQRQIWEKVLNTGRCFVSWEDFWERDTMSGEIVKTKNKRKKDAVACLIQLGMVRVTQSEVTHHRPARNAKYISSSSWVVVEAP